MAYHVGDVITIEGELTNRADAPLDPTVALVQYKDPSGNTTTLTYPDDAALVKDSIGNYHVDIDADEAGYWQYRFYSTGTGQATSSPETFTVYPSAFE